MANAQMRKLRTEVHAKVDPIWKNGDLSRKEMYRRLSKFFGKEFHIGSSSIEECKQILNTDKL